MPVATMSDEQEGVEECFFVFITLADAILLLYRYGSFVAFLGDDGSASSCGYHDFHVDLNGWLLKVEVWILQVQTLIAVIRYNFH